MTESAELLRAEDVAARLRISARRVRMIPAYELPYLQLTALGVRRYRPSDVARYLERRTVRS